jgi:hypothetical protein
MKLKSTLTSPQYSTGPEWFRIPRVVELFGISRSTIFLKIADGGFESVLIKQPGAKRGVRLISAASVRRFIESFK